MDEKALALSEASGENTDDTLTLPTKWGNDLHYRALFEQTGESVFIIGMDFRYLAANRQALDLLGYQQDELIGMPVSDVITQDDALGHDSLIDERSNLYERILKRKDGFTLPVEISTSVVYNEKGEPAYIQSIARDISERKNAERILRRHTRILSAIADATVRLLRSSNIEIKIPEVLESLGLAMGAYSCVIFDINTFSADPYIKIQYQWNQSYEIDFDLATILASYIPDLLKTSNGYFSSAQADGKSASLSKPAFVAVPINGDLGLWGFLGFLGDAHMLSWSSSEFEAVQTAANLIDSALLRNRYEETIRLNETRNRIILNALPDLLIRIDVELNILDYNANDDHPLYIHRDMITGRRLSQIWPDDIVRNIVGEPNKQYFTVPSNVESFHLPHSNHTFESRLYPISSIEALILIRDITEQAKLNEMKSDFINRASHELRTPLTSSILMTELIQEGGTAEEVEEYWRTLKSELNRQKILIDRLLIAGRLESGMMNLDLASMDILPILEESLMAVKAIASKRRVSLKFSSSSEPLNALGDKSGLQQVFINLVNNAVKFSREGGEVRISVSQDEDEVHVKISDEGVGIPQEAIPYLFERFYRARNVTIAEIPGSGIGLYIVKSIVDELGGKIEVNSVLNKGTTFTICLKRH